MNSSFKHKEMVASSRLNLKMEFFGFSPRPEHYIKDYFKVMEEQDRNVKPYLMTSPQLNFRTEVIDWLHLVCTSTNLNFLTLHHGILMLDIFMDKHDISAHRLRSVAACCLMLAAKLEQSGNGLPKYASIFAVHPLENVEVPKNDLISAIEKKLLKYFEYRLLMPTVAHFIYFLLPDAVQPSDLLEDQRNTSIERTLRLEMRDYLHFLLNCILYNPSNLKIPASWLACASVINARIKLKLSPSWPDNLAHLTGYYPAQLAPALGVVFAYSYTRDALLEQRNKNDNTSLNDSGNCSLSSSSPACKNDTTPPA